MSKLSISVFSYHGSITQRGAEMRMGLHKTRALNLGAGRLVVATNPRFPGASPPLAVRWASEGLTTPPPHQRKEQMWCARVRIAGVSAP